MDTDLQRATLWKRMAAWLLDMILIAILAVGAAATVSALLNYEGTAEKLDAVYDDYGTRYGVDLRISQAEYSALTEEKRESFNAAIETMNEDEAALLLYNKLINTTVMIVTLGLLVGIMIMEFLIPLILKNGQTVGKKCFGIGLMREDGIKLSTMQLFVRALLGKYTLCSMLPGYLLILLLFGKLGLVGLLILFGLFVTQMCLLLFSRNHVGIPDQMAATVQVDLASQKIFESTEDLVEYTRKIHADRARRQNY